MNNNNTQSIAFSEKNINALWLTNAKDYYIANRTIVINLGNEKLSIGIVPEKHLYPRESIILKDTSIKSGDSLLLIEVVSEINIGSLVLEDNWKQLGELVAYPKDIPLWKSPQYSLGIVEFDPYFVTGINSRVESKNIKKYQVKVNLWFATARTNCAIHNHHMTPEFLEVHTQVYGIGRMQKFHENDYSSLYQDVIMGPGNTHVPFASVSKDGAFNYPWHQYYADDDCIWVANEFHPIESVLI